MTLSLPVSQYKISASSFYNYSKCHRRVYLDLYGNPDEKGEHSDFLELLWEQGIQVERRIVDAMREQQPIDIVEGKASAETFDKTLSLMKNSAPLIYQGVLIHQDIIGRPDLLERVDGKSGFGDYYYIPCDIKSGRATKSAEAEDIKEHYTNQVLLYAELLEKIQGRRPHVGKIIDAEGQVTVFEVGDYSDAYEETKAAIHAIVYQKDEPEPIIGSVCKECVWQKPCLKWAEDRQDLSLLSHLNKQKYQLRERGITTMEDLSRINVSEFLLPPNKIKGAGETTLIQWKRRAQVWLSGKPLVFAMPKFRQARREIFYDIEDDPSSDHVYLHGFIKREGAQKGAFQYFLANGPEEEQRAARELWSYVESLGEEDVIYHYGSYEKGKMDRLQEKYGLPAETVEKFGRLRVDLYQIVKKSSDWPLSSYGIKPIAKYLGFRWSSEDASGANSIAWYADYRENPANKELLQKILTYNREDCEAMMVVKDWLQSQEHSTEK